MATVPPSPDWLRLSDEDVPFSARREPSPVRLPLEPGLPDIPGFEILGILGRGGMGVVYKARQCELDRVVALKMLLAGQHSDATSLARFRSEGEAIARLQHPNIVQIFEIGSHQGLPYLVLEYVTGGSLDEWLRHRVPSPEEAAALVETVARAVHAAHQQGLIHRDLKPANILLAPAPGRDTAATQPGLDTEARRGKPGGSLESEDAARTRSRVRTHWQPKITDFGLAKRLEDTVGLTRSGVMLGTPAYMAPEQLGARRAPIGPSADIYALGVILYEMLAGRPPFQDGEAADVLFQISLRDPITPRYWRPHLPPDLETICLKCLHKDSRQRYATAQELGDDLRRFLEHKPVHARPVGPLGRAGRWCRRHPVTTALLLLIAVLLAATVGASAAGFLSVRSEEARAENARQDAEARLELAEKARQDAIRSEQQIRAALDREQHRRRQLQDALGTLAPLPPDDLLDDAPALTPGHRALLQQVADVFRKLAEDARHEETSWPDAAVAFGHVGRIQQRLGAAREAELGYREAIRLFDLLAARPGADLAHRRATGTHRIGLGRLLAATKRPDAALAELQQGLVLLWRVVEAAPGDVAGRQDLALGCSAAGSVLFQMGRTVDAEWAFCQAVSLEIQLVEQHPAAVRERRAVALCLHELSQVESQLNRPDQWELCLHLALISLYTLPRGVVPDDFDQPLATIHNDLAVYLMHTNRLADAEHHLKFAVRRGEQLVVRFPNALPQAVLLGGSYTNLGWVLTQTGRVPAALDYHRKAINVLLPVYEQDPNFGKVRLFLRNAVVNRATALDSLEHWGEAGADWEWAARLSSGPERAQWLARQALSVLSAGDVSRATATAAEAGKLAEATPDTLYLLAQVWARAAARLPEGKPERETACVEAVALLRRARDAGYFRNPAHREVLKKEDGFTLLRNRHDFLRIFDTLKD